MAKIKLLEKRLDNYRVLCIAQNALIEQMEQIIIDQEIELENLKNECESKQNPST